LWVTAIPAVDDQVGRRDQIELTEGPDKGDTITREIVGSVDANDIFRVSKVQAWVTMTIE